MMYVHAKGMCVWLIVHTTRPPGARGGSPLASPYTCHVLEKWVLFSSILVLCFAVEFGLDVPLVLLGDVWYRMYRFEFEAFAERIFRNSRLRGCSLGFASNRMELVFDEADTQRLQPP